MKALKILVVVVALVAIAGIMTETWAQCPSPALFRSSGSGGLNVRALVGDLAGDEIGRFWDTTNATVANNRLENECSGGVPQDPPCIGDEDCPGSETCEPAGGLCESSLWWVPQPTSSTTQKIIDGRMDTDPCFQKGCPAKDMTVVIEDYDTNGPPGVGGTAYFIAWAVSDTQSAARWWDYARVDGLPNNTNIPVLEFPGAIVDSSNRNGSFVEVTVDYADQSGSAHSCFGPSDGACTVGTTTDLISEWHLMQATGTSDPGRLRSSWVQIAAIPYQDGGDSVFEAVECTDQVQDEYLAVGIGFNGGTGVVDSVLVGEAVALECNPNLANPDEVLEFEGKKPGEDVIQAKPRRSGGRR